MCGADICTHAFLRLSKLNSVPHEVPLPAPVVLLLPRLRQESPSYRLQLLYNIRCITLGMQCMHLRPLRKKFSEPCTLCIEENPTRIGLGLTSSRGFQVLNSPDFSGDQKMKVTLYKAKPAWDLPSYSAANIQIEVKQTSPTQIISLSFVGIYANLDALHLSTLIA